MDDSKELSVLKAAPICQLPQLGDSSGSALGNQDPQASTAKRCDNEAVDWVILYGTYAYLLDGYLQQQRYSYKVLRMRGLILTNPLLIQFKARHATVIIDNWLKLEASSADGPPAGGNPFQFGPSPQ